MDRDREQTDDGSNKKYFDVQSKIGKSNFCTFFGKSPKLYIVSNLNFFDAFVACTLVNEKYMNILLNVCAPIHCNIKRQLHEMSLLICTTRSAFIFVINWKSHEVLYERFLKIQKGEFDK
jgi:hypothetical protein